MLKTSANIVDKRNLPNYRKVAVLAMEYSHLKVKLKSKSNPTEPWGLIQHTAIAQVIE